MHPFLFEIYGMQAASYGTCMVLGIAAAWIMTRLLAGKSHDAGIWMAFAMCLCGAFAGSFLLRPLTRLPELIINWRDFRGAGAGVAMGYLFGEIVFYGGLIGAVAALLLFCRGIRISPLPVADLFAPGAALGHAFGRLGCFLGGCCYGVPVDAAHPLAVRFPVHNAGGAPPGIPLLPVQLIEAVCLLIISAILCAVYIKACKKACKKTAGGGFAGITVCIYGILYAAARFVLEFYRGDPVRGIYGPLSTSQYISISVFAASALLLTFIIRKYRMTGLSRCPSGAD